MGNVRTALPEPPAEYSQTRFRTIIRAIEQVLRNITVDTTLPYRTITDTSYTPVQEDSFIVGDTTSNDVTINLPAVTAEAIRAKHQLVFKKVATGNFMILDAAGSDTIDGAGTYTLTSRWDSATLRAVSGGWYVIGAT